MSSNSQSRKNKMDAYIQRSNIELLNCIDEMRLKRDDLQKDIKHLKDEQSKLQYDLGMMTSQLTKINESLCRKLVERERCDAMISDYDTAFNQLIQGSETLLTNMRRAIESVAPLLLTAEDGDHVSTTSRRSRSSRMSHSSTTSNVHPRGDLSRGASLPRVDTRATDSRAETHNENRIETRADTRTSQNYGD